MTAKKRQTGKSAAGRSLLEAAREHQDALLAAGLPSQVLEELETALRGVAAGGQPGPAAQVLIRDVEREVGEIQAAVRKEFPGNASFQSVFKADVPVPGEPRQLLALGRLVAREAPEYSANLIKYAINAATVKHLSYLCDQLQKELGGADPSSAAKAAEEQIRAAAARAFKGRPELAAFGGRP
ncbi:MAG TPA: hypothetical protein VEQ15_06810 [Myxococcales bacterium]|nr:hypothetical protein [Myxococcales bacterium]